VSSLLRVRGDSDEGGGGIDLLDEGIESLSGLSHAVGCPSLSLGIIQIIPNFHQGFLDIDEGFKGFVWCFHGGVVCWVLLLIPEEGGGCQGYRGRGWSQGDRIRRFDSIRHRPDWRPVRWGIRTGLHYPQSSEYRSGVLACGLREVL